MSENMIHSLEKIKPIVKELLEEMDIWLHSNEGKQDFSIFHELNNLFIQMPTPDCIDSLIKKIEHISKETIK